MPIYQIQAPNGKVYNVEGPANADDNTLFAAANQLYQQDVNKQLRKEYGPGLLGTFAEGVGRGVEQLKTTFGDVVPAMAGQALGFEDYAKAQMQEAAEAQQRIQAERPPIFESYKEIESPYQFAQFGAEVLGEQFSNILTSIVPGVGGGALAGRAALATVSKALTAQAAKRGLVGEAAELFVAEGVKRAAPSIAAKSAMGANVGAFLGSYTQTAPEVFQNIVEKTGQMELGTSMLFGAGSAALDSILPATLSKQLSGPLKAGIVEKVLEKSGMDRGLLRSTTAGLFTGVAGEGLTEGAQEAINIAAERFVEDNPEVFGSKEWDRIMEASVRGAIAGGGFGVAGGAAQRLRERAQEQIDAAAQEAAQTGKPVLLQLGYDPRVKTPTAYGGQPIYVYPDGSTSFVSELSPEGFAEKYKEQINVAAQEDAQTGEPALLQLGYDPRVKTPTAYGGQPIYVYPDGSTSFVSELSPEGFAEKYKEQSNVAAQRRQKVAQAEREIAELQAREPQMQLSEMETGVYTALVQPEEIIPAAKKAAKEKLSGKQLSMFGAEGELTKEAEKAATADQKRVINIARQEAQREAAEQKADQERVKKFLSAKQVTLPGFSPEEVAQTQRRHAELQAQAEATGQGDIFAGMPTDIRQQAREAARLQQEAQREAAEQKADQERIKKFLSAKQAALQGMSVEEFTQAQHLQAQAEATGQGDIFAGMPTDIRQQAREAAEQKAEQQRVKEGPAALKKAIAELTNAPTNLVSLAKGPTPLEQTVRQARGELDALSAKRVPKTVAPAAEPVAEPTKRAPPSGLKGTIIPKDKKGLAAFGAQFNIGNTATILREDGPLAGKDLSDPAQANIVKKALEAYASGKPAKGAADKIAEFLKKRPEFKTTKPEVPSGRVDREPIAGTVEPSVPSVRGREVQADIDTTGTTEAIPRGLDETRLPAGRSDEGEGTVERALTPRPTAAQPTAKSPKKRTKKLSLPVHRGPDLDTTGRAFAEAKNLRGLVTHLQNTASSKPLKAILAKVKGLNLNTKLVIGPVGEGQAGSFDPRTNTITLDPQNGLNEHTVLHEVMHAAISHVLRNPNLPVTKQLTSLFNQLQNQLGAAYGAQDIQEFASELVSNPEFQALLKTLKAPKSESMFTRFMQTLAEFFGFAKNTSAYDKGLKLINDALDISGDVEPSVSDLLFLGTPNGAKTGFDAIRRAEQSKPSFTGKAVEATRNRLSNLPDDVRSVVLGLVSLDHINAMYKGQIPSLQKVIDYTELRAGMQEKRIKEINEKYTRFQKVQKKHPQDMERMNALAIEARREQVDVIDPKFKPQPAQRAAYQRLKNIYSKLHPDVQRVYQDIRADYDASIAEYEDILLNSVEDPSARRKLKAEYEARKRQIGYIPFLRRGDFWVEYDENGERVPQAFESRRERQNFINTQLKGKKFTTYQNLNEATYSQGSLPPTSFIVKVMSQLEKQDASPELKNNIYQSYLSLFPAESLAKNFMRSENFLGMERDIVRGYGETMIKWARMLAATKYNPEIDKAFREVQTQGEEASKTPEGAGAFSAAEHVLQQAEFIRNPTYNKFVNAATTFNYFTYIAGSVASALVNLSTIPMFSWSMLGARYGFDKAASALFESSKVTINYIFSGKVPPKYAKLMQALDDHAQLQHTTARELLEGQRQKTSEFVGLKAKAMDLVSIPFAKSELLNRGATAIAAYDLARASGKSEADAIRYALDTNKELNTSGLGATAPRYLKHPVGRIFFAFKTFAYNSAFVVARAFHQAVKGQSPEVKREARRQLLGIYGTAIAFAGVQGLPFMGAVSTVANMIGALFGDEDEPFDFKLEMRQFVGDLPYKGGLNYATNLEIASRISIANDLLYRDDPKSVAEHGYVLTAMAQAFGPLGSYALSAERGAELLAQGQLYRGVEAMMPTAIKNAMKGGRYMQEGVLNTNGEPIIEDISTYNNLIQIVGFSPANLTNVYEEISVKKGFERDVLRRRTQLLDKYDMARRTGDYELMQEAQEEITEFNSRRIDAKAKITPDTLRRSEQAREAAERDSVHGVRFNKALMPEIDKLMEEE